MKLGYILKEGFSGFSRAKLSATASITTITISLFLIGIFFVISINASRIVDLIREKVEIEAFLEEPATRSKISEIRQSILKIEGVDSVIFVTKEIAAEIFRKEFGEDVMNILDFNPFPSSFKIYLKYNYKNSEMTGKIYESLKSINGIDDVVYRKDVIEFLEKRAQNLNFIGLIIGIILGVSSVFLVSNTIRLAIYSKRKIIQNMKLVGATRWFIRLPFLLEGLIQGITGGIFSTLILLSLLKITSEWLSKELFVFLNIDISFYGIIILVGGMLGLLGSFISVRKFIKESIIY